MFAAGMIQVVPESFVLLNISVLYLKESSRRPFYYLFTFHWQAELKGKRFLCRTAASFVSARIGIIPKAPISPNDLGIDKGRSGGLIIVGSYVPKTTKQVSVIFKYFDTFSLFLNCIL